MNALRLTTLSDCPELVEGLSFFLRWKKKKGQGFDKLSPNGAGVVGLHTEQRRVGA